ncbi:Heat shock protein 75 kDa, mitochondrial [Bagarius yarrelli]|uniref:Heat shock protein 75 kDa, mitochondrial n=1 Tax=Bagarius yarrelli TaxID=175774 RepID=A0A556VXK5_BAGYA|nr:Heat shock protein 75 kDa, mitochondrial [Bagarius yarrelli]
MQIDPKVIECIKSGLKSTAESDAHSYWSARVEKGRGQAASPYYEAMKIKDMEVLFCYEQFDELTLLHLREFNKKKLISLETDIVVDHYKEENFDANKPEQLSQQHAEDLMAWMRNCLGQKVTPRLDSHPSMITVLEMGAVRHFLRTQQLSHSVEERAQVLQPTLEINAGHDLIKKLYVLKDSNPDLAQMLLEQIFDNAMITAGLNDDPRPMISRLNDLLTKAMEKH